MWYILFHRKQIVSSSYDRLIKVWDFKPNVRPFTYKGHKAQVNCVDVNSTGALIASCSKDGTVKLWPNRVKPKFSTVKAHTGPVECVEFSSDD